MLQDGTLVWPTDHEEGQFEDAWKTRVVAHFQIKIVQNHWVITLLNNLEE